jgi:hypothetical protein
VPELGFDGGAIGQALGGALQRGHGGAGGGDQIPVQLLEQGTAQHRFGRQALPSGCLDAMLADVCGHQAEQIAMLIEPSRHRFQFAADLVLGVTIEYAGLDGAFLAHCRAPAVAGFSLKSVA